MADTRVRYVRIDDDTWAKAQTRARDEQTTVSEVLRDYLTDYANDRVTIEDELLAAFTRLGKVLRRMKIGKK